MGGGGGGGFRSSGSSGGFRSSGSSGGGFRGGSSSAGGYRTGGNNGFRGGTGTGFRGNVGGYYGNRYYGNRYYGGYGFGYGYPYAYGVYPYSYGGYPYYDPYYYDAYYDPYAYSPSYYDGSYYNNGYYAPSANYVAAPQQPPVVINQAVPAPRAVQAAPSNEPYYHAADFYLIAFNDHTIRAALNYRIDGDTILWTTREHEDKSAPLSSVDRRFSEQINRDRHVEFRLP